MIGQLYEFPNQTALAECLADRITDWAQACNPLGRLELSGGSTPQALLGVLQNRALPPHLDVLPVDDRCVPLDHEYSNARLLQSAFGVHRTRPLFDESRGIGGSIKALKETIGYGQHQSRFCILGLGLDGHTASLFPGSPDLATGLDACAPTFIAAQPTMEPRVPRITMTAPFILAASVLVLHFHGVQKRELFERAQNSDPETHPIAHFLRHPKKEVDVYYAP